MVVHCDCELTAVEDRRLHFTARVYDDVTEIAAATHERVYCRQRALHPQGQQQADGTVLKPSPEGAAPAGACRSATAVDGLLARRLKVAPQGRMRGKLTIAAFYKECRHVGVGHVRPSAKRQNRVCGKAAGRGMPGPYRAAIRQTGYTGAPAPHQSVVGATDSFPRGGSQSLRQPISSKVLHFCGKKATIISICRPQVTDAERDKPMQHIFSS